MFQYNTTAIVRQFFKCIFVFILLMTLGGIMHLTLRQGVYSFHES